jgi:hypothetical protein
MVDRGPPENAWLNGVSEPTDMVLSGQPFGIDSYNAVSAHERSSRPSPVRSSATPRIAVRGVGGSGTRLVAQIVRELGVDIGQT